MWVERPNVTAIELSTRWAAFGFGLRVVDYACGRRVSCVVECKRYSSEVWE